MIQAFLKHSHGAGVESWDIVIAKSLSLVLVSAFACRPGEVSRSKMYKGEEYLKWGDIDLYCDGEPIYSNLRAAVTLRWEKSFKDRINEDSIKYLRPLTDDLQCHHMCPIALLLTHALRHGLVVGSNLSEVLLNCSTTFGHRVSWTRPELPVTGLFTTGQYDPTSPASTEQLNKTIKEMAIISNILDRVYSHALRSGSVRDIAHLPSSTAEDAGVTS